MASPKASKPCSTLAGKSVEAGRRSRRPSSASSSKPHLVHETVRAELNAARAGTRGGEEPRARRRRPRQAVAPEGHRAAPARARPARRTGRAAASRSRPRCAASRSRSTARPAAPRSAARSRPTPRTARSGSRPGAFDAPSTKGAAELVGAWGKDAPLLVVAQPDEEALIKSFRNLDRVDRDGPERARGAPPSWARLAARHRARARARAGEGAVEPPSERSPARAGGLREELRPDRGPQVLVPGPQGRAQDSDPPGRRGAVRRQRDRGQRAQGAVEAQAARPRPRPQARAGRRPSSSCAQGETIEIFEGAQA